MVKLLLQLVSLTNPVQNEMITVNQSPMITLTDTAFFFCFHRSVLWRSIAKPFATWRKQPLVWAARIEYGCVILALAQHGAASWSVLPVSAVLNVAASSPVWKWTVTSPIRVMAGGFTPAPAYTRSCLTQAIHSAPGYDCRAYGRSCNKFILKFTASNFSQVNYCMMK